MGIEKETGFAEVVEMHDINTTMLASESVVARAPRCPVTVCAGAECPAKNSDRHKARYGRFQGGSVHRVALALFAIVAFGSSLTLHAQSYIACAGTNTVGGAGNLAPGGGFTVTVAGVTNHGSICDLPTTTSSGVPADEYWLEIQNSTNQTLICSGALWVLQSDGTEYSVSGANPIFSASTARVTDTGAVTNTGGIDAPRTRATVQCAVSTQDTGGSGGSSSGGNSGSGGMGTTGTNYTSAISASGYNVDVTNKLASISGLNFASNRPNGTIDSTGTLVNDPNYQYELWASLAPYNPTDGTLIGYRLARFNPQALAGISPSGVCCISVTEASDTESLLTVPPSGSYYVIILATSISSTCPSMDHRCLVTAANMSAPLVIPSAPASTPAPSPPAATSSSGSTGGGGALDTLSVLTLVLFSVVRIRRIGVTSFSVPKLAVRNIQNCRGGNRGGDNH